MTIRKGRAAAYLMLGLGCVAGIAAAIVPFYTVGYRLDGIVLSAILVPFAIYGTVSASLRTPWLLGAGLVLLGATLAVVIDQRFLNYDGYRDGTIYWVPLLATAVVPLAYVLGRRPPYAEAE